MTKGVTMVDIKPVNSSNIAGVGYDAATQEMHVQFSSGATYSYIGVPPEHHEALANADSIGAHFAKHIRPNYTGKRVR
jgi:hypothetical protein